MCVKGLVPVTNWKRVKTLVEAPERNKGQYTCALERDSGKPMIISICLSVSLSFDFVKESTFLSPFHLLHTVHMPIRQK